MADKKTVFIAFAIEDERPDLAHGPGCGVVAGF